MKFTKVTYSRLFPLQQFSNERIEVEIQLDDHESEVAAFELAKKTVMQFHEQSVKEEEEKQVVDISGGVKTTKGSFTESIKRDIDKQTTLEGLNTFNLLVNNTKNQELISYLEERKKQFKNG
jgi:hypothetical protein